jgi:uncharacterized protein (DUF2236 family)
MNSQISMQSFIALKLFPAVMTLPSPLQRRLETAAANLINPDRSCTVDFATPIGEPALSSPDSISWLIFKNPLALFVGGIAAVLLELGEPRVRAGVWNHTSFKSDPLRRIQRTGFAAMITVYGPRNKAETLIARVRRIHAAIGGATPDGQTYRADDPRLLAWVHATASFGFLEAYNAYVRRLSPEDCNRYFADGVTSALMYGAEGTPASQAEMAALFKKMTGTLDSSPVLLEFLDIMERTSVLPSPFNRMQGMLVKAAVGILPPLVQEQLGLKERWSLSSWERHVIAGLGMFADRILIRSTPAVQACRRMGLADDYLYQSDSGNNASSLASRHGGRKL